MTFKVIWGQGQGEEMTSVPYQDYFVITLFNTESKDMFRTKIMQIVSGILKISTVKHSCHVFRPPCRVMQKVLIKIDIKTYMWFICALMWLLAGLRGVYYIKQLSLAAAVMIVSSVSALLAAIAVALLLDHTKHAMSWFSSTYLLFGLYAAPACCAILSSCVIAKKLLYKVSSNCVHFFLCTLQYILWLLSICLCSSQFIFCWNDLCCIMSGFRPWVNLEFAYPFVAWDQNLVALRLVTWNN